MYSGRINDCCIVMGDMSSCEGYADSFDAVYYGSPESVHLWLICWRLCQRRTLNCVVGSASLTGTGLSTAEFAPQQPFTAREYFVPIILLPVCLPILHEWYNKIFLQKMLH